MEYMFLLYSDDADLTLDTVPDLQKTMERHSSIMNDASARGKFRGAGPLQPVRTAMTARSANGKLTITDGPFAETKETLGGYYIIDCNDADEAGYWAGRLTETGCATAVEFRALLDMPEPMQRAARRPETADAVNA